MFTVQWTLAVTRKGQIYNQYKSRDFEFYKRAVGYYDNLKSRSNVTDVRMFQKESSQ